MQKAIATIIFGALASFIGGLAVVWAQPLLPSAASGLAAWVSRMIEAAAFPWICGAGLGLAAGYILHVFAARYDSRHPRTPEAKARRMAPEVKAIAEACRVVSVYGFDKDRMAANEAMARAAAMTRRLSEIGIKIPQVSYRLTQRDMLMAYANAYGGVAGALEAGEIQLAENIATHAISTANLDAPAGRA